MEVDVVARFWYQMLYELLRILVIGVGGFVIYTWAITVANDIVCLSCNGLEKSETSIYFKGSYQLEMLLLTSAEPVNLFALGLP